MESAQRRFGGHGTHMNGRRDKNISRQLWTKDAEAQASWALQPQLLCVLWGWAAWRTAQLHV